MQRKMIIATMLLLVAGGTYFVFAAPEEGKVEGKEASVTGKLSCTFCKFAHPDKTCTPDCCVNCVKAGDPPLLTDAQGNMFILLTGEKEVPLMTSERMKMLGGEVTVKGVQVKRNGIQAIYVDSIEKAEAQQVNHVGKLSCTFCKLAHPDKDCTPDCCIKCVKAGDPPMLTDTQGNVFILLTGEKEVPLMTPQRLSLMGGTVRVKGLLVNRNGMKVIFVDSIEKSESL